MSRLQRGNPIGLVVIRIFHEGDGNPKRAAVEPAANQIGAISDDNHESVDTGLMCSSNDVLENGLATKIYQRLGKSSRYRPDAGPVARGENKTLAHFLH